MSKRDYTHVRLLYPEIKAMIEAGKTQREIAEYYGFKDKYVVKELLKRERRRNAEGIPKQRGRKPAKTLAEYKYENKRLKMENVTWCRFVRENPVICDRQAHAATL